MTPSRESRGRVRKGVTSSAETQGFTRKGMTSLAGGRRFTGKRMTLSGSREWEGRILDSQPEGVSSLLNARSLTCLEGPLERKVGEGLLRDGNGPCR